MTKLINIVNGNLVADPTVKILESGVCIWNFAMVENHSDDATLWINFTFYDNTDHPVLKKAKKGSSLQVLSKFAFKLDQYTFTQKPEKNSYSIRLQASSVDWGVFEKKDDKEKIESNKPKDSSTDFYPKDDLIPASANGAATKAWEPEFKF